MTMKTVDQWCVSVKDSIGTIEELRNLAEEFILIRRQAGNYIDISVMQYICQSISSMNDVKKFCKSLNIANQFYPEEKIFITNQWWRWCQTLDRIDVFEEFLTAGFKIVCDGNVVRQLVYAGRLDMAKLLLDNGYSVPTYINLFQISSQLSWKKDRIKFLCDNGTKIQISDEEKIVMKYILDNQSKSVSVMPELYQSDIAL